MNAKNGMRPVHPGEVLREELDELGLSANALSKALGVPVNRVTMILNGQRGVSADTALRLARYFGTTPQLWLNLQKTWELRQAEIGAGSRDRRAGEASSIGGLRSGSRCSSPIVGRSCFRHRRRLPMGKHLSVSNPFHTAISGNVSSPRDFGRMGCESHSTTITSHQTHRTKSDGDRPKRKRETVRESVCSTATFPLKPGEP